MPMSLQEQVRLLWMVDILGPLSPEEMEDLAKRTPDTFLEGGDVLYVPQDGAERLSPEGRQGHVTPVRRFRRVGGHDNAPSGLPCSA